MVATVVSLTSASSTVLYFEQDGYYAKGSGEHRRASRWHGAGAAALGLEGPVDPDRFAAILEGRVPGTDVQLGRVEDGEFLHKPGLDLTLSPAKSVSLEALLYADRRVIRAHDEAVRDTIDFVEGGLLLTRRFDRATRKMVRAPARELVLATFRHVASRNLDPQLHTHVVIANMTRDGDGTWRSLDLGGLDRKKHLVGAFYRDALARRLRELGFALRPSMIGHVPGFEIEGYGRALLDGFSSRRREMLAYLRERGWSYTSARAQQATLATRKRKREPHREELAALWREHPAAVAHPRDRRAARPRKGSRRVEAAVPSALEVAWRAAEQLEERVSVFPAHQLAALALAHSPGRHGLGEVEAALAQLRRDGHLHRVVRRWVGECFVTDRAVRSEREVVRRMRAQQDAAAPLAAAGAVAAHLADSGLTDGQRDAVRTILLATDRTVGVQGYAGTGKTTMLAHVKQLAGGRRIVGLAPSASAARTLGRGTGIPCRTVQWFLARHRDVADGTAGEAELGALRREFAGSLLVVDEMSLASTQQALGLLRIADRLEVGRLVLVGDTRQLRSVEAGQPFRQLQAAGMRTALMRDIRRQRNPDLRAAVLLAVGGKPEAALGRLGGNLVEVPSGELAEAAAHTWLALPPEDREVTLILAPTHELRARINDTIREGLQAEGTVRGRPLTLETLVSRRMTRPQLGDLRHWSEGDVALFHNALKRYRIEADDACVVTGFEGDAVLLEHPDGTPRHIRPGGNIRYRLDLCEPRTVDVQAGDRIRWTRNDQRRNLLNGATATIAAIGPKTVRLRTDDGRALTLRHDDPQLRHVTHAWASTVQSAQGVTSENVIAVLDSGHGLLSNQQTFYVEISRARENAIILTDNREQLVDTLESHPGLSVTALEALGESLTDDRGRAPSVKPRPPEGPDLPGPGNGVEAEPPARLRRPVPAKAPVPPEAVTRDRIARAARTAVPAAAPAAPVPSPADEPCTEAPPSPGPPAPRRSGGPGKEGWLQRFLRRAAAEVGRLGGAEVRACLHALRRALHWRDPPAAHPQREAVPVVDRSGYRAMRANVEAVRIRATRLLEASRRRGLALDAEDRRDLEHRVAASGQALAEDDAEFARRTAEARWRHWFEQWNAPAPEPTAATADHRVRDELAAEGRRILTDPALPYAHQAALSRELGRHGAVRAAARKGAAWVREWQALAGRVPPGGSPLALPDAAALFARGQDLLEDGHLPDDLRPQIEEPVAAEAARRDELQQLDQQYEQARVRALDVRRRREADRRRERRYVEAFDEALAAGRKGAGLTPGRLHQLIAEGEAIAADQDLPGPGNAPERGAGDVLADLRACAAWRRDATALEQDLERFEALCRKAQGSTHMFVLEGGVAAALRARELAGNKLAMDLFPDQRKRIGTTVGEHGTWLRARERYEEAMAGWKRAAAEAATHRRRWHETAACRKARDDLRSLRGVRWLDPEQQQAIQAIEGGYWRGMAEGRERGPRQSYPGVRRTPNWSRGIE